MCRSGLCCREIVELWAHGESLDEVVDQTTKIPPAVYEPFGELPFRFEIDDYMQKIPFDDQLTMINKFSFMPLRGPVSMKSPKVVFSLHCDATTGVYYFGRLVNFFVAGWHDLEPFRLAWDGGI